MRLEQLMFVKEVAKTKSMSTAANNLYVTPQYISKAIKQLEEELNLKIFRRTNNGVFLTLNGEKLYEVVEDILGKIDFLSNGLQDNNSLSQAVDAKKINIVLPPSLNILLNNIYADFLHKYPLVDLTIRQLESVAVMQCAETMKPDIFALAQEKGVTLFSHKMSEQYDVYFLFESEICGWSSYQNQLIGKKNISLKDLANLPLVLCAEPETESVIEKFFQHYEIKLNVKIRSTRLEDCVRLVNDNPEYVFLNTMMLSDVYMRNNMNFPLLKVLLKDNARLVYRLYVKKDLRDDLTVNNFLNKISAYFKKTFRKI